MLIPLHRGFSGGASGEESALSAGDSRDPGSIPGSGRSRRRKWQPTPVFLPGNSRGRGAWSTVHGVSGSQTRLSDQAQHVSSAPVVLVGHDCQFLSVFIFCHSDRFVVVLWGVFLVLK